MKEKSQHNNRKYTLNSVNKALELLECFDKSNHELSVPELAKQLKLSKSSVYRIVYTLWTHGYLARNEDNYHYRLGYKILTLGAAMRRSSNLIQDVRPYLKKLMEKTGETTHLAILHDNMSTFIEKIESPKTIQMSSAIGARMPAYCSATGKMLLSGLTEEALERYLKEVELKRFTPATITDIQRLKEELNTIREQGYSIDEEETEEGLMCISAPIKDHSGEVVAAISISGPVTRLKRRKEEYIKEVKTIAHEISSSISI